MKIRTQLIAGIIIFALLLVILSGFIVSTNLQLEKLMEQEDIANSIALDVSELGYLSNDYILYHEGQQTERWHAKYALVAANIAHLDVDQPEQQAIASSLASNLRNTKSVFDDIASSPPQSGGDGTGFVQISWSRMAIQTQGMIFDAGRLADLLRHQENGLRTARQNLIFALMGSFVALLLTSYFLFYRHMLRSIGNLQNGAQAVGSGDFSHTIDMGADDEIGDLARSFNLMTKNLKTVTASKAELEREVASRKRAEEDLVYANDRLIRSEQDLLQRNADLNALNEELTATQEELQQNIDELTRAEVSLRQSEERFRVLLQHVRTVAVQGYAPDGTVTYWNEASERIYGYTEKEATGKNLADLIIPPEMRDEVRQAIARMAETGEPIPASEHFLMRKDGSRVPVFSSHGVVSKSSGQMELFCIDIDLTERKRAEEALRKSEEEYRHVVEYAPASIYEISADGLRFNRVNDAMCRILGYTREELMAMSPFSILDLESRKQFRERIEKRSAGEDIDESVAYRVLAKDGRALRVTLNVKLNHGRGESTLVVAHDVTERMQAEEALRETSQYLNNLINYANAPIIVWDPLYRITRFNHAFELLTGMAAGEAIGKHLSIVFPESFRDAAMDVVKRTMEGERLNVVELPVIRKDGNSRVVLWNSATLYEPDGKTIASTIAQGQDITERKIAEEELKRKHDDLGAAFEELTATQEELHQNVEELSLREQELLRSEANLKEALTEKEVLLSEIHHRVKNNLAAFISLLSLDGTYEDSEAGRALKKDLQNRARSMALIHETLYRTGRFSNVDMEIYLTTLVGQVAATFRGKIVVETLVEARGMVLDLSRATTAGLIINELVTNSFKYAFLPPFDCAAVRGEPCTIRITITEEEGIFIISVADNGRGLPADLDPLTAKSLGLKLVNFLARHQLRAEIAVRENKGTEYIFRFNITEDHP